MKRFLKRMAVVLGMLTAMGGNTIAHAQSTAAGSHPSRSA